jgi:intein/homing endonuclease
MSKKWTESEENEKREELRDLYIIKNLPIRKIGEILGIRDQTVFARLKRLNIKTDPSKKERFRNFRTDITIPKSYSGDLAELFGILLGDGHISHFQIVVTLGTKEPEYAEYVQKLVEKVFGAKPKIGIRKKSFTHKYYRDVYLGSVKVTKWLIDQGLKNNKVESQVDVPRWIFKKPIFMKRFLRGFFDTDGSIYKLKFGIQISLSNKSQPILHTLHELLVRLRYSPSAVSADRVYITRIPDIKRFFAEIKPKNQKHTERFKWFISQLRGSDSGYSNAL